MAGSFCLPDEIDVHLVNSFNAGVTNDFITPTDSADSGDPITSAGPGCQYNHNRGHYCVICPNPGDELVWEQNSGYWNWWPDYYIRFDLFIAAGQPSWGLQQIGNVFLGDSNDPTNSWNHFLWVVDDGRLYVEDDTPTTTFDLPGAIRFGQWNTITLAQNLNHGNSHLTVTHEDGTTVDSGPVVFPGLPTGYGWRRVALGRPGNMGSGGTTLYVDNLRGYNTATVPAARAPRTGGSPETPGPHTSDPWTNDPDPTNTDPDDPTWNPVSPPPTPNPPTATAITPTHGPDTGGTVVTITGTDLTNVHDVLFGFTPGTSIIEHGGSSLTVTTPNQTAGTWTVQIDTDGGSDSTRSFTFDPTSTPPVTPPPVTPSPVISTISPGSGPDTGGTAVTIIGTNLTGATVTFGGTPGTGVTVTNGGTKLVVASPPHTTGGVTVKITTPGGSDTRSYNYTTASAPVTPPPVTPHDPEDPIPGPYPDDPWTPPTPPVIDPHIPTPSVVDGPTFADEEILYSTAGFTQRSCELGVNQGVIPAGTVMAKRTSNKRWYPYSNSGNDGIDVARGILRWSVDTDHGPQLAPLVIQGILKLAEIHGLDAAALTDLGGTVNAARGFLRI